jgi:hypothetical protein
MAIRNAQERLRRLEAYCCANMGRYSALTERLKAARLRLGLLPPTPERLMAIRGMSIVQILQTGRKRVHEARREREIPR